MTTIYEHDGKEIFKDDADSYEIEEIRTHYSQFDTRLVTATYTVIPPEKEGEPRRVVFAKKVGVKGQGTHPAIAALLTVPPARPEAFSLISELLAKPDQLTVETLIFMGAEIEAAQDDLDLLSNQSRLAVERCLKLRPAPAPIPPVGF